MPFFPGEGPRVKDGLLAQIKGEKLVVVPRTADGFRATVSAVRSLDGSSTYIHIYIHNSYMYIHSPTCPRCLTGNFCRDFSLPLSVKRFISVQ